MPVIKNNTNRKPSTKKTFIVTKIKVLVKSVTVSKKLEKVNVMLDKTKWLDA